MTDHMHRITVIGTSCSGKTTFARQLAERLSCRHIQLDAVHWGPDWTAYPEEQVRAWVEEATRGSVWVIDGNYAFLRDVVWPRADTVVWLNYSFPVIASRALRRTFRRSLRREELYNGNRESLRKAFLSRDSILWWVLQTYRKYRREYPQILAQEQHAHLRRVEFRRPAEAERFLDQAAVVPGPRIA